MPPQALAYALAAAFVHALWNVLVAGARDIEATTAAALMVGVVVFAPVAATNWRVETAAVPYIVGSSAFELAYVAFLAAAYRRADLSVVYPLTRGAAPVLVLVVSVIFLGVASTAGEVTGVVLVAGGILLVRGPRGRIDRVALLLAAAIACCIAGYTLLDRYGVQHANPLAYVELVLITPALVYPADRRPAASAGGIQRVCGHGRRRHARGLWPGARSPAARLGGVGGSGARVERRDRGRTGGARAEGVGGAEASGRRHPCCSRGGCHRACLDASSRMSSAAGSPTTFR